MYIGCHVSSSKGYVNMIKDSLYVGGNTFQFFTRNPRGGAMKKVEDQEIVEFNELLKKESFTYIIAHAPYTLNPCSNNPSTREFALKVFKEDLELLDKISNVYYNFHPGSHVGQGVEEGINLTVDILNKVITKNLKTTILIETMAGKGSEIGFTFEQIKEIMSKLNDSSKVGVCLDTCHIFDAGYDLNNDLDQILSDFDRIIGLEKLKAIHLNNSKNGCGSHKDRHEKIKEGNIELSTIKKIINHPYLKELPFVLETPNELDGYKEEISLLKEMSE